MVKRIISITLRIGIVLIGIAAVAAGRGFFFYEGFYQTPPIEMPSYEGIAVPPAPATEFSDNYSQEKGTILVDLAHGNTFDKDELNVLWLRLTSRGLSIKFFGVKDNLKKELLGEEEKEEKKTGKEAEKSGEEKKPEEKLEVPNAFIVVSPEKGFSREDSETVEKFVSKGGKLLLVSDPTRFGEVNSLAIKFGLLFEPDYLYNMKENEINYRNIFVAEFKESDITRDLKKIALYTAGSISSANASIAFADNNTFSSLIESRKGLSPLALTRDGKVLALYDLTFMIEPYNGILDNNRLIANVADWLMSPGKAEPK